jgi:hypothetical protein
MLKNLAQLTNDQFDDDRDRGKFKMATRHGVHVQKNVYKLSFRCHLSGFIITMAELKDVIVRKGLDKAGVGSRIALLTVEISFSAALDSI